VADPRPTALDQDVLVTVRTLLFPVQYEPDPAGDEAVDWVVRDVIDGDTTGHSRADYLDDIRRALSAKDEDLAAALREDAYTDAQIRAFLRAVAARLDPAGAAHG
jgi:hypothetical protein